MAEIFAPSTAASIRCSSQRPVIVCTRPKPSPIPTMSRSPSVSLPHAKIEHRIVVIRGHRVMLDDDLAVLYGVPTKRLNEQVRRNADRFPHDFMFRLSHVEVAALRSPFATSKGARGGRRYLPYAFTEQGVAMLSSVLHSQQAVRVNIEIMRAFVRLRAMTASYATLARKVNALERKYDAQFKCVFDAIRRLMEPPARRQRAIGFRTSRPLPGGDSEG